MKNSPQDYVMLVDEKDTLQGTMEKIEAHEKGLLHRAFSVFIFNRQAELLLQQRAVDKYHCPGLWTNSCCSHQKEGEQNIESAMRRLQEELGIKADQLWEAFHFIYRAEFDNGLIEHEYDHVILGSYTGVVQANPSEVAAYQWISFSALQAWVSKTPEDFTPWFKLVYQQAFEHFLKRV